MALRTNPLFRNLSWKRWTRLVRFFRADLHHVRAELVLALICSVGTTLAVLARPWPIKLVFDYALIPMHEPRWALPFDLLKGRTATGVVTWSCVLLLGIALLWGLFSYQQRFLIASAGQRLVFMVRRRLFAHLQRLSLSVHTAHKTGDLVLRATGDANMLRDMLVDGTLIVLSDFSSVLAMIGVMLYLDWRLTLVSLTVLPLMTVTAFRFAHGIREAVRKQRKRDGRMASLLNEVLHSIVLVQAFSRERHEDERFAEFNRRNLRAGLRATRLEAQLERTVEILVASGTAGVLWFGVHRVLQGFITPGDLLVFTGYLASTYRPLRRMTRLTSRLSKATISGERIYEILTITERVRDRKSARPAPPFAGRVRLEDVTFGYRSDRPVVRNVSFEAAAGQLVGIVGPNGAGKSTLLALILRLYDPAEGKVRIDGAGVKRFTLESLREQIGIVLQQALLFGTTIHENIAFGKPDATRDEVVAAAKAADAHEFIMNLPEGYETVVAEGGASLSGGQRQKISVARAILKDPPILLLDEPTTGLDAPAAAEVNATLARLGQVKTTFRVAHRLADVANADLILVLRDGRIAERGTHAELLAADGWYRRVYAAQQAEKQPLLPTTERRKVGRAVP